MYINLLIIVQSLGLVYSQFYSETLDYSCPNSVRQRPSIYALSDNQWSSYVNSIKKLNSGQRPTKWDQLSKLHADIYPTIHSKASFLAWHRAFLYILESELQKIDKNVMIPYWDWTRHSQAPENDPVFSNRRFGGNGQNGNQTIADGSFSDMLVLYNGQNNNSNPQEHIVRRKFDMNGKSMGSWISPDVISGQILESPTFERLWKQIEAGPHGVIHNSIGADFSGHSSPSDPLFFSHHAFVDKLWHDWTKRYPERKNQYFTDDSISFERDISPFRVSLNFTMETTNLCYTYPEDHFSWTPKNGNNNGANRNTNGTNNSNGSNNNVNAVNGTSTNNTATAQIQRRDYATTSPPPATYLSKVDSYEEVDCDSDSEHITYDEEYVMQGVSAPDSFDRTNQYKLRVPKPMPQEFLERMKYDIKEVREIERGFALYVNQLNLNENYVSEAALINKDKFAKLRPRTCKRN